PVVGFNNKKCQLFSGRGKFNFITNVQTDRRNINAGQEARTANMGLPQVGGSSKLKFCAFNLHL
ncbi:MAG: hypothetical protein LC122_03555, partial [Chitinophagales bacterium]|nr:hypothetical protein [Chitinophagales bacterium]